MKYEPKIEMPTKQEIDESVQLILAKGCVDCIPDLYCNHVGIFTFIVKRNSLYSATVYDCAAVICSFDVSVHVEGHYE